MRSRLFLNLMLLVLVAGLGWFFYARPKSAEQNEFRLSDLQAPAVKKIIIAKTADSPYTVERHDNRWFVTAPVKARADANLISQLLSLLTVSAKQRLAATDLARFDLLQPWAKLTFDNQEISFGAQNPLTREQYVATEGYVYLIPSQYASTMSLPGSYFLSHSLLTESETPVGFELPGLTLTRKDGKWESVPANKKFSQDRLNSFADEWKHAYSMSSRSASSLKGPSLRIRLDNSSALNFRILQQEPDVILLREDEMIAYQFPSEMGVRLIDPLAETETKK
jgi:hypothetical protein